MQKRKIVYIVAMVVMEIASQEFAPPQASGTIEKSYSKIEPSSSMISMTQEKYEDLLKYKWKWDEGMMDTEGWATNLQGANDKLEEAYAIIDNLTAENNALKERLKNVPEQEEEPNIRKVIGGGLLIDSELNLGYSGDFGIRWKKIEPFIGVDYFKDDLKFRTGVRYTLK